MADDRAAAAIAAELQRPLKPADYLRLARAINALGDGSGARPVRVALLSSYTIGFLEPLLVVEAFRRGLRLTLYAGAFGQFEQELLGQGPLASFEPDVLVLAMRPEDVEPDAVIRYHATNGERYAALTAEMAERLANCVRTFRARSKAPVLVANWAAPAASPLGPFEANVAASLGFARARANAALQQRIASEAGAVIWDYAGLVEAQGAARWTDPRLMALARVPVSAECQPAMAAHLVRTMDGVLRTPAKCLVLDLDQTLWGGVIGDDGPTGIKLGDDYPGNAFKAFQRAALSLADRGILLAVVSKNEQDVALQAMREHPDMLIRPEQVAAMRINWEPKSGNLRAIAKELNIGADALVLFDDNPVERAEVRANAPEVGVIDVPADPVEYVRALMDAPFFDQVSLTAEDRARVQMYRSERERQVLAEQAGSVEEFLAGLEMNAVVGRANDATLARISQLIEKTNQFNLTTRRHASADVAAMAADKSHVVGWLRLHDRFGDQGLVTVAIVKREGDRAVLDTFLMSCRVMNRFVEHAMMAWLVEQARKLGCVTMIGEYRPTKKNGMVKEFYPGLGFTTVAEQDGVVRYELPVATGVAWPAVIRRTDG